MAAWAPFSYFLSSLLPYKPSAPQLPPTQLLSSPSQLVETRKPIAPLVFQEAQARSEPLSAELASVVVDDNEPEERLLNRFRREVMKAGVVQECKRRKFFENKQDERKRRTREAAKRNRRRRPQPRTPYQKPEESSTSKKTEGDDNWDMPEETPN